MNTPICTTNRHDHGLDLVLGHEVTGQVIGRVTYDDFEDNPGYVLRVGEDERAPDTIDDVISSLAEAGFELDSVSLEEVAGLAES
jgi:hypothetical protein